MLHFENAQMQSVISKDRLRLQLIFMVFLLLCAT
ncbi:hypothetical protein T06_1643 [Trichinella sp. T6]|nr:hypothetical protein T06_1643 [Trichinella sp. T6]